MTSMVLERPPLSIPEVVAKGVAAKAGILVSMRAKDGPLSLDVCCQVYAHNALIRPCGRPRRRLTWKP